MIGALIAGLVPTALGALAGAAPQLFTKSRTEDRVNNIYSSSGNPALAGSMSGASASIKQDRYKETIKEPTTFAKIAPWLGLAGGAAGALAPDIKNLLKDDKPEAKKGITEGKKGRKIVSIEPIEGKQHEQGGEDVEVGGEQVEAEGGEFKVIFDDGTEAILTAEQMEMLKQGEDIESIVQELPTVEEAKKDVQTNDLMQGGSQVPEQGESASEGAVMARRGVIDHDPLKTRRMIDQLNNPMNLIRGQNLDIPQSLPINNNPISIDLPITTFTPTTNTLNSDRLINKEVSYNTNPARTSGNTRLNTNELIESLNSNPSVLAKQRVLSPNNLKSINNTSVQISNPVNYPQVMGERKQNTSTLLEKEGEKDLAWKFYKRLEEEGYFDDPNKNTKLAYPIEESIKDLNKASLASNALISAGTIAANIGNNVPDFTPSPLQAYDPVNIERVNPNAVLANINKQANTAMRATTEMGKDPTKALGAIFDASNQAIGQVNQANLQAGQSEASINQQGANQVKGMNAEINRSNKQMEDQNEKDKITQKTQRLQAIIDSIGKVLQSYVGGKSMLTQDMINRIAGEYGDDYGQVLVPDKQALRKEKRQLRKNERV